MTPLTNQFGKATVYLHKKMLIDLDCKKVMGMVIGNCVFGNQAEPVGKIFSNTLRDISGRIVAKVDTETVVKLTVSDTELINETWRMLMHVKTHVAPWVPELFTWSDATLEQLLSIESPVLQEAV